MTNLKSAVFIEALTDFIYHLLRWIVSTTRLQCSRKVFETPKNQLNEQLKSNEWTASTKDSQANGAKSEPRPPLSYNNVEYKYHVNGEKQHLKGKVRERGWEAYNDTRYSVQNVFCG